MAKALRRTQQIVGLQARRLRHARGLTQEAAEERIGVSTIQLGRLKRGDANVTLATLVACAVAYRVDVAQFLAPAEGP